MQIFWILALAITAIGGSFLFLFFAFSLFSCGTRFAPKLAEFLFDIWVPILCCSGIFILLIIQIITSLTHDNHLYYDAKKNNDENLFFYAASLFRTQRNLYILVLGLVVIFGNLVIAWQSHMWSKRNGHLQSRIRHAQ